MAEPIYCTAADLRTELGVDSSTLPDPAALKLIQDAEDLVDEELGVRPVDEPTGRKVVQADVDAWRFTKLGRATAKLAAALYKTPELVNGRQWRIISSPDFTFTDPLESEFGTQVMALLNQSGLRRLTTGANTRPDRPPWDDFSFNRTADDYDPPPVAKQH